MGVSQEVREQTRIMALRTITANLSSVQLLEHRVTPTSDSACQLQPYVVLVKAYEENLTPHRQVLGNGRSIFIAFFGNRGYSSLILHQNSTSGVFSKIVCCVESEITATNFLSSFILKPVGLSYSLNELFTHGFVISRMVIWKILVH